MISSKHDLKEWIEVERSLWIHCNYPNGIHKNVKSKELLFLKSLRYVEYYGTLPKVKRIIVGGEISLL